MKKTKNILASTVISGALALQGTIADAQGTTHADRRSAEAIRTFHIDVSNADLKDLRKRILATRWPDKETSGSVAGRAAREAEELRAAFKSLR